MSVIRTYGVLSVRGPGLYIGACPPCMCSPVKQYVVSGSIFHTNPRSRMKNSCSIISGWKGDRLTIEEKPAGKSLESIWMIPNPPRSSMPWDARIAIVANCFHMMREYVPSSNDTASAMFNWMAGKQTFLHDPM